jgi:hypothetical protein
MSSSKDSVNITWLNLMSKIFSIKFYFLILTIIVFTIESSYATNNNYADVAVYLLDETEQIPSITKKYWAKINYSYATITSCDRNSENLNQCVRDELENIIKIKQYPQKVILITDIRGAKTTNFLNDDHLNKRVSLFIYFRPENTKDEVLKKSAHTSSSIFLVGKNDRKEVIRSSIDTANYFRSAGHNIWTTWLTSYPDKNSHETTILSPQVILLVSSRLGALNNKYQEFLTTERIWQNPPISDTKYYAASKYILSNQVNERFINSLRNFYSQTPYELHEYDLKTYSYFDVLNYFSGKQKLAGNNYLKLENRKGRVF